MSNTDSKMVRGGKWALVETATEGLWQVVNVDTGNRSIPMDRDAAARVFGALCTEGR